MRGKGVHLDGLGNEETFSWRLPSMDAAEVD